MRDNEKDYKWRTQWRDVYYGYWYSGYPYRRLESDVPVRLLTAAGSIGGSRGETTIARLSRITYLQRNSGEYRAGSKQQRGGCVATHAFISSNRRSADTRRCRTRPIHLVQVQKHITNIFDKY